MVNLRDRRDPGLPVEHTTLRNGEREERRPLGPTILGGDDDRYAVPATDLEGPVDRTNLRGRRLLFWVKGGCGRQADGTAGLPPAPEIPRALRQYASCHQQTRAPRQLTYRTLGGDTRAFLAVIPVDSTVFRPPLFEVSATFRSVGTI
jgi:hypothetical protein